MNKPVITIQCGNYANYVGAHFWNLQESGFVYGSGEGGGGEREILEVDNDVLYREGLTLKKEVTYTPRLILMDLKGSLGSLPECGELYGRNTVPKVGTVTMNWAEGHQIFKEEPYKKNDYLRSLDNEAGDEGDSEKDIDRAVDNDSSDEEKLYNLEDQVAFWSDYLGARFHQKSVLLCDSYQHQNSTHPFDMWGSGREAWNDGRGLGDEMEDRIRFFAEECDNLGGFQIVSDFQDGFGGASSSIVNLLADEYSNKSLLSFPVSPAEYSSYSVPECGARLAGAVLSLASHLEAGLVTPLSLARDWFPLSGRATCFPHLDYKANCHYSSSAVTALALDTATLPTRRRPDTGQTVDSRELAMELASHGRKVATISAALPVDLKGSEYFESELLSRSTPLMPGSEISSVSNHPDMIYTVLMTVRGLKSSSLFSQRSSSFKPCPTPTSYLESCIHNAYPNCRPLGSFFTKPVNTCKPFPHIFSKKVNSFGTVESVDRLSNTGVSMSTILTSWEAGPISESSLRGLCSKSAKLSLGKVHRLGESGVEAEEWEDSKEKLHELLECYSESEMI